MNTKRKIVIIGAGHVGSTCAYTLATQGVCDEIVLIDINQEKARAQAMDIADCVCFLSTSPDVRDGDYSDVADADIIVMAAGVSRKPGQTRLDMLGETIDCMNEIITHLQDVEIPGILISISNPADIVADYLRKMLGLPRNRIFSTGTSLDTARTRRAVADACGLDPRSVVAYALGEHGDSSMVAFSHMTIWGKNYKELKAENPERFGNLTEEYVLDRTHQRGMEIVIGKGSTETGISMALCDMAKAVLNNEHKVLPASPLLEGEYGQHGIHAGVPCIIGRNGIEQIIELKLTEEERQQFNASCNVIREHMKLI